MRPEFPIPFPQLKPKKPAMEGHLKQIASPKPQRLESLTEADIISPEPEELTAADIIRSESGLRKQAPPKPKRLESLTEADIISSEPEELTEADIMPTELGLREKAPPKPRRLERLTEADIIDSEVPHEAFELRPKTSLVKNLEGEVIALRADEQFIPRKEAFQGIAGRFKVILRELDAYHQAERMGGRLTEADARTQSALEAEASALGKALDQIRRETDEGEGYETRIKGGTNIVENPFYQPARESVEDVELLGGGPDVEGMQEQLVDLMYERDSLMKRMGREDAKAQAAKEEALVVFEKSIKDPRQQEDAQRLFKRAGAIEVGAMEYKKTPEYRTMADELKGLLDQIDDVEFNLRALKSKERSPKSSQRRAA